MSFGFVDGNNNTSFGSWNDVLALEILSEESCELKQAWTRDTLSAPARIVPTTALDLVRTVPVIFLLLSRILNNKHQDMFPQGLRGLGVGLRVCFLYTLSSSGTATFRL